MQAANILLVENTQAERRSIEDMLHTMGHCAEAVGTGERGLQCFQAGAFDVVLSDVGLPDMDGIDLIAHIRNTDPTVVPIALTDRRDYDTVVRAMEEGAQSLLNKPVSPDRLASGLQRALNERKQRVDTRHMIRDLIRLRASLREKMLDRERFLDHVLDAAPFGILTTGKDGRILTINKTAEQMYACAYEDVAGRPVNTLWGATEPISDDQTEDLKTRHMRKNGESFSVMLRQRDIVNHAGEDIARLFIVEDISKSEQMEAQLLYAERLSMLGQLAPRIAHEFKTPLQVILGNVDLALGWVERDNVENAVASMANIPEAARNLLKLVQQMSELGKPSKQQYERVDLNHELARLIEALKPLGVIKYCRLHVDLHPDTPRIYGDPDQIDQAFRNLIVNAAQAMEDSEKRVLTIATAPAQNGACAQVEISDTGQGIPPNLMKEIFQPFFTTKPEGRGTGLGLPIVKTILDRHRATCHIDSKQGVGTSFKISFLSEQA